MAAKKPKYHFEGTRKDAKGNDVYVLLDLKTNKEVLVSKADFDKKEKAGEVER